MEDSLLPKEEAGRERHRVRREEKEVERKRLLLGVDADVVDEHFLGEHGGVIRRARPITADRNV